MTDVHTPLRPTPPPVEGNPTTQTPSRWRVAANEIMGGSVMISILSVVLAMIVGAVLIALTDETVQKTAGYFFSRPGDMLSAVWQSVSGAYSSLFQGAIYNFRKPDFVDAIKPLTATLNFATPLIMAGLGIALGFRAGMFNIGGRGQMLIAIGIAGWIGFSFDLPFGIHMIVAVIGGMVGGALWAAIVGLLKARTGAHEVITTIMLNFIAYYLISYLLRTPGALQAPGSNNPKSPAMKETAIFPHLFGPNYPLNLGFIFAIVAVIVVWWLLSRSSLGFKFRAVGENPDAAKVAGINVGSIYVWAMVISGALVGLAGVAQILGTVTTGFSSGIDAGIGFDAITVALLGRSRPWGTFWAAILFGALKAGGFAMQAAEGIPIDIVLVVQSMIVLFIAAPPLVRAVFRLPTPGVFPKSSLARQKVEVSK
ncbi:ABC transporter permease [Glaciibacter psychrotolerans]|uniref:Simple sugar transport system permease protein n=1 Tax=Glaciibacter psychrotolerans TaxID=670054 RepID=A0A7Z0EEQ8_9MICO|nr:ABC transporter permease [Leifsonia psychrotolerans]NYJ20298.1 simple sugar transport system permease protein [Leifsonia psychrotolerans]